ncbi:hypothetical protein [Priestia taiwanensis]|uniref:Uncharacterized protein n=1 Tax=Priestia taiwanensis TaxID=1347902 RepID=A0A917AQV3_9BACI|nr:hypothetical protein [Priestia taiwanensis]MBM7362601.1 hypothetical protein [Priestia taiwanensis]GGE63572.1 hypothetical protein GCM10007140_12260 [Priestia taiwanensis]
MPIYQYRVSNEIRFSEVVGALVEEFFFTSEDSITFHSEQSTIVGTYNLNCQCDEMTICVCKETFASLLQRVNEEVVGELAQYDVKLSYKLFLATDEQHMYLLLETEQYSVNTPSGSYMIESTKEDIIVQDMKASLDEVAKHFKWEILE